MTTAEILAECERVIALSEKATPGEWWVQSEPFEEITWQTSTEGTVRTVSDCNVLIGDQEDRVCCCHDGECDPKANAEFIAAARESMPCLARLVKRLVEEREILLDEVKTFQGSAISQEDFDRLAQVLADSAALQAALKTE